MALARMEAYLGGLASGLEAHPQCQQKGSIVRGVLRGFPLAGLPPRPPPVQALIEEPPLASSWVSEDYASALYLAICDAQFPDDGAYIRFSFEFNRKLLRSPLYRVLMVVATPTRLMRHAGLRWGALHRGSRFAVELSGERSAHGVLHYPPHLFPELLARCFGTAFQAAVECSGRRRSALELTRSEATSSHYKLSWE